VKKKNSVKNTIFGKAAVFNGTKTPLEIRTYPVIKPEGDGVLLRLERSGICGTDLHIIEGRLPIAPPFIPGHEFIGKIMSLGPKAKKDGFGSRLTVGDLAIACVGIPCGKCFNCRQGETASCLKFGVTYLRNPDKSPHFFGGYGQFVFNPAKTLVKIPNGINLDAIAAFPCAGPTGIRAFDFAGNLKKNELVVVQGTGPVGLFAVAWAVKAGCKAISIGSGSNPARIRFAKKLGANLVIDYRKESDETIIAKVRKMAEKMKRGDGADVVFEASGSPKAIPLGLAMVRTLGKYIIPGQYSNSGSVEIQPQMITFKAIKIIGSGQYKLNDIRTYIGFLKKHKDIQAIFAKCITRKYKIDEANRAMDEVSKGTVVKGVFI
jgi:2-desacetyl-2-hydroxyethyl bacteriochlorophyllide A dehydrogenase